MGEGCSPLSLRSTAEHHAKQCLISAGEPGRERERAEKNASAATRGEGCEQEGMCEVGQMCSRMSHTRTK